MTHVGMFVNLEGTDGAAGRHQNEFERAAGPGVTFQYEHGGGKKANYPQQAQKLLNGNPTDGKPDVVFGACWPSTDALRTALKGKPPIPIIYAGIMHPDGDKKPEFKDRNGNPYYYGDNVTGIIAFEFGDLCKWWPDLLTQIEPKVQRAAVIYDPTDPALPCVVEQYAEIQKGKIKNLTQILLTDKSKLGSDIANFARDSEGAGGLIVPAFTMAHVRRKWIIDAAAANRLPAIYSSRTYANDRGLMSYGPDVSDLYRQAGDYVKQILADKVPASQVRQRFPVIENKAFELVVNTATASALGVKPPAQFTIDSKKVTPTTVT